MDRDFEISDEEFAAAKAHCLKQFGEIPPSLQRVIDMGGRFAYPGSFGYRQEIPAAENCCYPDVPCSC